MTEYQTDDDDDGPTPLDDSLQVAMRLIHSDENDRVESIFRWILENHPESSHALTAIEGLFFLALFQGNDLEEMISELDSLRETFETALHRKKIDDVLALCQLEIGMYDEALSYYESVISDPPTAIDSVYAAIGYCTVQLRRLLMEDGGEEINCVLQTTTDTNSPIWHRKTRHISSKVMQSSDHKDSSVIEAIESLMPTSEEDYNSTVNHLLNWIETSVGKPVEGTTILPTDYFLEQCYPNPFNSVTLIKYGLPEDAQVKLVVYDVLGREVLQLVDGQMKAGYHSVLWVGTNVSGSQVSSGLYLYRLETGTFVKVKKMTLIK